MINGKRSEIRSPSITPKGISPSNPLKAIYPVSIAARLRISAVDTPSRTTILAPKSWPAQDAPNTSKRARRPIRIFY